MVQNALRLEVGPKLAATWPLTNVTALPPPPPPWLFRVGKSSITNFITIYVQGNYKCILR